MTREEAKKILEAIDISEEFEMEEWTLYDELDCLLHDEIHCNEFVEMETVRDYIASYGICKPFAYKYYTFDIYEPIKYDEKLNEFTFRYFYNATLQDALSGDTIIENLNTAYEKFNSILANDCAYIRKQLEYQLKYISIRFRAFGEMGKDAERFYNAIRDVLRTLEAMITIATSYKDDEPQGEEE